MSLTETQIEGLLYIIEHPFEDLRSCDWISLFPETSPIKAIEYQVLAKVFHHIHQHWQTQELTTDSLKKKFRLPLNSLGYINEHLTFLSTLKILSTQLSDIKSTRLVLSAHHLLSPDHLPSPEFVQ